MSGLRRWDVGGAVILDGDGSLLLVKNMRRNGVFDWTPPGGVIEVADGETLLDGLTREVNEETGLVVTRWIGPLWDVEATSVAMGFHLNVEVWQAAEITGELNIGADPDGIVVDAAWVPIDACALHLEPAHPWVREPLAEWLGERFAERRSYRYEVSGSGLTDARARRL